MTVNKELDKLKVSLAILENLIINGNVSDHEKSYQFKRIIEQIDEIKKLTS